MDQHNGLFGKEDALEKQRGTESLWRVKGSQAHTGAVRLKQQQQQNNSAHFKIIIFSHLLFYTYSGRVADDYWKTVFFYSNDSYENKTWIQIANANLIYVWH